MRHGIFRSPSGTATNKVLSQARSRTIGSYRRFRSSVRPASIIEVLPNWGLINDKRCTGYRSFEARPSISGNAVLRVMRQLSQNRTSRARVSLFRFSGSGVSRASGMLSPDNADPSHSANLSCIATLRFAGRRRISPSRETSAAALTRLGLRLLHYIMCR